MTRGVANASRPTARPPSAGRSGSQIPVFASSASHERHAAHDRNAEQPGKNPEQGCDGEIAAEHVADLIDADAKRQRGKPVGDEIARHRGNADRRQAHRGISADHQFEGVEGAGQRRAERARNCGCGPATDHDALIGAAQVKSSPQ